MNNRKTKILFSIGVVIILIIFAFSLFKNISRPLLWNDEASTAMFGRRISEYGYPKTHDEKNSLYLFSDPNFNAATRENGDVYIGEGWSQYYLAAFGDYLGQKTDDIYTKTALLRIPFAIAGFLGIIIFGLTISIFFKDDRKKAFIVFFLFELISISLILHLREVRYYSLVLLFGSILLNVYLRYTILKTLSYKYYFSIIPLFLTLLFYTHYPVAAIFLFAFGLYSLISAYLDCGKKLLIFINNFFKSVLPLLISLIFIVPSLIYFKTFKVVSSITTQAGIGFSNYINNINIIIYYFSRFEFLYLAIFLKILLIILLCLKKNPLSFTDKVTIKTSNFLLLFSGIYILIIARTIFAFTRYFIILQPILVFIILLDILLCWHIFNQTFILDQKNKKIAYRIFIVVILLAVYMNITPQMTQIKGHLYELSHQYKGPLDYVIPYIKEKYDDPSKIVIATNYEENSYMYYLKNKTIIGYVGNNIEEDKKLNPDVIILRKYFLDGQKGYLDIFDNYFKNKEYQEVNFPIYDYPFNNIPELMLSSGHLFKTKFSSNNNEKLYLYFKK